MELITSFETLSKEVLRKYEGIPVTMGILVADHRQTEAREYILNYLNLFDEKSGKYIDFYLPGYFLYTGDDENEWENRSHQNIDVSRHCSRKETIYISRLKEKFYFDEYLFEDFLRALEKETGIKYAYGPMLVLVEVDGNVGYGSIKFQNRMVIDLDDGTARGIKRSGELFDAIFEFAKRGSSLYNLRKEMRMHYIKGASVNIITGFLSGDILETVKNTGEGVARYRIKRRRNG